VVAWLGGCGSQEAMRQYLDHMSTAEINARTEVFEFKFSDPEY
jgi:hypothetical protein